MADSIDVYPGSDVVHRRWYGGNDRLTSLRLQSDEEFRYDGLGRLITRRDGQQLGIVTSYDGNKVVWKNGVFFVPGGATDDILAYVNGPSTCHFIPFSGRLLYDDCPVDWPQIGEYSRLIKESFTFSQLSRQAENDASNSFFRNRWYDAKTGRFTQEDPIGFGGGSNLYAYAGNNPVSYTDPFGLCPWCIGGGIGAAIGAGGTLLYNYANDRPRTQNLLRNTVAGRWWAQAQVQRIRCSRRLPQQRRPEVPHCQ